jgi:hypothetical protein
VNRPLPRWPLYLIASPAAVAVWSGWVGLGTLCGFGVVHPLPGIADGFTINTAITLPVGVEAYGAYALRAWLTPGTSETARRFARWSAIGALTLGMLGQVVYHLLSAAHATRAPWPVVTLVSCLPVVALALGSGLAHLLREAVADDALEAVSTPMPEAVAETVADVPGPVSVAVSAPVPAEVAETVAPVTGEPVLDAASEGVSGAPVPRRGPEGRTVARRRTPQRTPEQRAERAFAAELAEGKLPTLRAVMSVLHVGQPKARDVLAHLASLVTGPEAVA